MNAFDRELQEKLKKPENLDDIAARLARHEKRTRIILIVHGRRQGQRTSSRVQGVTLPI